MVSSPEDLSLLKKNWVRFWKKNCQLPRELWIRETIDIWLEHVSARFHGPARLADVEAEVDDLVYLAKLTGQLPDEMPPPHGAPTGRPMGINDKRSRAISAC